MRAAYITKNGESDVLQVGDLPTPQPKRGEVLVRVKFAALNHLDLWIRRGLPGIKLAFPHILGADCSGVVREVGEGATRVKAGDEVVVHPGLSCGNCNDCSTGVESLCAQYQILGEHVSGTNAEYVSVPECNVFPKPEGLSFEQAAAMPLVFITAWEMLVKKAGVKKGDSVLVHAAGSGVSSAAIQIAKLFGAQIIATSGSDEKLERAKQLGADHTINTKTADFVSEVRRLSAGGMDIIIDHVGKVFWEKNVRVLRSGGVLVTCGATSGWQATTDLRHLFFRQLRLVGSTMGSKRDFPEILSQFTAGKLKAVVDKTFPLVQIESAHAYLEAGEQFGKVIISV